MLDPDSVLTSRAGAGKGERRPDGGRGREHVGEKPKTQRPRIRGLKSVPLAFSEAPGPLGKPGAPSLLSASSAPFHLPFPPPTPFLAQISSFPLPAAGGGPTGRGRRRGRAPPSAGKL